MSIARRRSLAGQPRDCLAFDDDTWPERDLVEGAPGAAHFAKKLALRPKVGCGGDDTPSIDAIAKRADINPQTISNLLTARPGERPPPSSKCRPRLRAVDSRPPAPIEDRPHGAGFSAEDQRGYLRPPS